MGFAFEDDVLEHERLRLTMHIESEAKVLGVEPGNNFQDIRTLNLCDRIWDGRIGDRWINVDLAADGSTGGYIKSFGLENEVDLLTLCVPHGGVRLDLIWEFHRAWLYERVDVDEMDARVEKKMRMPPAT